MDSYLLHACMGQKSVYKHNIFNIWVHRSLTILNSQDQNKPIVLLLQTVRLYLVHIELFSFTFGKTLSACTRYKTADILGTTELPFSHNIIIVMAFMALNLCFVVKNTFDVETDMRFQIICVD